MDCAEMVSESMWFGVFIGALGGAVICLIAIMAIVAFRVGVKVQSKVGGVTWKDPISEETTFLLDRESAF